ncbi:hypothetical protein F4780DRAFT_362778 [Xylariomycetidae sp. FL0641]|nr:hypothetical protein F4780DRAFT_362778 [Xylariomycetidae sp. FL0641]
MASHVQPFPPRLLSADEKGGHRKLLELPTSLNRKANEEPRLKLPTTYPTTSRPRGPIPMCWDIEVQALCGSCGRPLDGQTANVQLQCETMRTLGRCINESTKSSYERPRGNEHKIKTLDGLCEPCIEIVLAFRFPGSTSASSEEENGDEEDADEEYTDEEYTDESEERDDDGEDAAKELKKGLKRKERKEERAQSKAAGKKSKRELERERLQEQTWVAICATLEKYDSVIQWDERGLYLEGMEFESV